MTSINSTKFASESTSDLKARHTYRWVYTVIPFLSSCNNFFWVKICLPPLTSDLALERPLPLDLVLKSSSISSKSRFFPDRTVTGLSRGLPLRDDARLELGVLLSWFFFLLALATNTTYHDQAFPCEEWNWKVISITLTGLQECLLTFGQLDFAFGGDPGTELTLPFPPGHLLQRRNGAVQMVDQWTGVTTHQHPPSTTDRTHIVIVFFFFLLLLFFFYQLLITVNNEVDNLIKEFNAKQIQSVQYTVIPHLSSSSSCSSSMSSSSEASSVKVLLLCFKGLLFVSFGLQSGQNQSPFGICCQKHSYIYIYMLS